jgi:hypothetical protein
VSKGCGSNGMRLLRRWSGVMGGECEGDEGARVGDVVLLWGGRVVGSKSRSGRGGETRGRLVSFRSNRRSEALQFRLTSSK